MKLKMLFALCIVTASLAACGTGQRRALVAIETAQQASTAALRAGSITVQQDRDAQARLKASYDAVRAATTAPAVTAAAAAAGVTP